MEPLSHQELLDAKLIGHNSETPIHRARTAQHETRAPHVAGVAWPSADTSLLRPGEGSLPKGHSPSGGGGGGDIPERRRAPLGRACIPDSLGVEVLSPSLANEKLATCWVERLTNCRCEMGCLILGPPHTLPDDLGETAFWPRPIARRQEDWEKILRKHSLGFTWTSSWGAVEEVSWSQSRACLWC